MGAGVVNDKPIKLHIIHKAVIFPEPQIGYPGFGGVTAVFQHQCSTKLVTVFHHVIDSERFHGNTAAYRRFQERVKGRAFFNLNFTDQYRVKVVTVIGTVITLVHRHGLFGAVDGDRYTARPLYSADIDIQRVAVAGITAEYPVGAFENIGGRGAFIALYFFFGEDQGGDIFVIDFIFGAVSSGLFITERNIAQVLIFSSAASPGSGINNTGRSSVIVLYG